MFGAEMHFGEADAAINKRSEIAGWARPAFKMNFSENEERVSELSPGAAKELLPSPVYPTRL